jgi:hypothetical protein
MLMHCAKRAVICPSLFLFGITILAAPTWAGEDAAAVEKRLAGVARYLSSDELEGRGLGSKGLDLAADFIAQQFRNAGLKTDLCQGGPFQCFPVVVDYELGTNNRVTLFRPHAGRKPDPPPLVLGTDYTPLAISGSLSFDLPLVFVGYGISSKCEGYDDYAGLDVTGKAVIVLRSQPHFQPATSRRAADELQDTAYTLLRHKASNAYEHGAAAVIFCTDHAAVTARRHQDDPILPLRAAGTTHAHPDLPVLQFRRAVVDRMLTSTGKPPLAALEEEIDRSGLPASCELSPWRIAGRTDMRPVHCTIKNVLGLLPGDGSLATETVVVGAHYDHLGRGIHNALHSKTGAIHHGADDNASGVAAIIEIARAMSHRPQKLRRQLLFISFTGEEWGFFGSSHYVNHPVIPLDETVAMINFDMVGRLRSNTLIMKGTATGAGFAALLDRLNGRYRLQLTEPAGGQGPSDYAAFYAKKIPIMHFFTGRHADYHRPTDTFEKLNLAGMREITAFATDVVETLADSPERPQYVAVPPQQRGPDIKRAYLGVIPDFTREEPGYAVAGVIRGSPAERAGLRGGDVIVQIGKNRIGSSDDLDDSLAQYAGGERLPVSFRRQHRALTYQVTLDPPKT